MIRLQCKEQWGGLSVVRLTEFVGFSTTVLHENWPGENETTLVKVGSRGNGTDVNQKSWYGPFGAKYSDIKFLSKS